MLYYSNKDVHHVYSGTHFTYRLSWKEEDGFTNHPDVDIKAVDPGDDKALSSVEYLGPYKTIPALKDFVKYFEEIGYERNKEIRAAPYDWRLAAGQPLLYVHCHRNSISH